MLRLNAAAGFKKDFKKSRKQGKDIDLLETIIRRLAKEIPLSEKYRDHGLRGNCADCRECHIQPDRLLGSHAELFSPISRWEDLNCVILVLHQQAAVIFLRINAMT